MEWSFNDGGREAAGYKGRTGDCVCRAIAIATETPYQQVYDLINEYAKREHISKRKKNKSNARTGVYKVTIKRLLEEHFGWKWVPTMTIGSGCTTHLCKDELPSGRIVANLSRHLVAVVDGVLQDTYDSSRGETRCVYGYWYKPDIEKVEDTKLEISNTLSEEKPKDPKVLMIETLSKNAGVGCYETEQVIRALMNILSTAILQNVS